MNGGNADRAAWVAAAADALRRHGSWTGRVHIHKHLFMTQVLRLADAPFEFVLYNYGPYSFELDAQIVDSELEGILSHSYPKPGYGPSYEPTLRGLELADSISPELRTTINRVAKELRDRNSQDLELIATCLWMERKENILDEPRLVERVKQVKPKYDVPKILEAIENSRTIASALSV